MVFIICEIIFKLMGYGLLKESQLRGTLILFNITSEQVASRR